MENALINVAAYVAIIIAGFVMGRSGTLGNQPGAMVSKIVFTFTLPCAVIHAFGSADFTPQLLLLVPLGFACAVSAYFVTLAITRKRGHNDRLFFLLNGCGFNIGCFVLPFVQAIFSPTMVVATCMFDAGNAFMMAGGSYAFTGLFAGSGKIDHPLRFIAKRLLTSLPFDAYLLLIGLALLNIRIPEQVVTFTAPLANANGFLAMFMLGLMMKFSFDKHKILNVLELVGLRLVYASVFTALIWLVLPFDATLKAVLMLLVWGPSSALAPMYTNMSGGDGGLAGFANATTIIVGVIAATTIALMFGGLA